MHPGFANSLCSVRKTRNSSQHHCIFLVSEWNFNFFSAFVRFFNINSRIRIFHYAKLKKTYLMLSTASCPDRFQQAKYMYPSRRISCWVHIPGNISFPFIRRALFIKSFSLKLPISCGGHVLTSQT
jgi:hypothetical protein